MWRIFDIKYELFRQDLPAEIIVDLNRFSFDDIDKGMGHFNTKVYRVIQNITGCNATDCKVEPYRKI